MLLALTALAAACTSEEATISEPATTTTEEGYTYSMHLDMPAPAVPSDLQSDRKSVV